MNKVLLIAGLALVVVGLLLVGTFPWAFYKSARNVDMDDYEEGDKITVYGKITDMQYSELINKTIVELDNNLTVYMDGKLNGFDVGDYVFMSIVKKDVLQFGNFRISAWQTSQKDIHRVSDIVLYFYILMVIGVALAIIAVVLR